MDTSINDNVAPSLKGSSDSPQDRAKWSESDVQLLFQWFEDSNNLDTFAAKKSQAFEELAAIFTDKNKRQVANKVFALENTYQMTKNSLKNGIPLTESDLKLGVASAEVKVKSMFKYYYEMEKILRHAASHNQASYTFNDNSPDTESLVSKPNTYGDSFKAEPENAPLSMVTATPSQLSREPSPPRRRPRKNLNNNFVQSNRMQPSEVVSAIDVGHKVTEKELELKREKWEWKKQYLERKLKMRKEHHEENIRITQAKMEQEAEALKIAHTQHLDRIEIENLDRQLKQQQLDFERAKFENKMGNVSTSQPTFTATPVNIQVPAAMPQGQEIPQQNMMNYNNMNHPPLQPLHSGMQQYPNKPQ